MLGQSPEGANTNEFKNATVEYVLCRPGSAFPLVVVSCRGDICLSLPSAHHFLRRYRRLSKQEHPLDPEGLCSVMQRIVESPSLRLTTLALVDCNLGNHGLQLLMTFLPTTRIKSVDLKRNGITVEGAKTIATSLAATITGESRSVSAKPETAPEKKAIRLEHLDLGYNRIGDAGALAVTGDFEIALSQR